MPPRPSITGKPIRLKSNGNNFVWLKATNVALRNPVVVRQGDVNGPVIFDGKVNKLHDSLPYARVSLQKSRSFRGFNAEELIAVVITITNAGQTGGLADEIIIDDVDPTPAELTSKKSTKLPSKAAKKVADKPTDEATVPAKKTATKKSSPKKAALKKRK